MAMLDRYKKSGGFVQLLNLIESSSKTKQEQFLGLIAQESPAWEAALRKKALTLDKILGWNQVYLSEVLSRIQPLTLATALNGIPRDRVELVLSCLGISDRRKIQTVIDESQPTPAEVATCIMKMLSETRALISSGVLKMDKIDPELMIEEHIEDHLSNPALHPVQLVSAAAEPEKPGELRFELPPAGKSDAGRSEETEFLKRKVNSLVSENASLKQEVAVLRGKLEQIKKIA